MKVSDYIADAKAAGPESAVSRINPQYLALWWQITFDERVELEDAALRQIQAIWESFGPVSIHENDRLWLARLQATAEAANQLLGADAWAYITHMGVEYLAACDHDARAGWIAESRDIERVSNSRIKTKRSAALAERIRRHFCKV